MKKWYDKTITKIETAHELLTGRASLAVVNRYLKNVSWLKKELRIFTSLKKRTWGMPVEKMLFQVILNFMDGTSHEVEWFHFMIFSFNMYHGLKEDVLRKEKIKSAIPQHLGGNLLILQEEL